MQARKLSSIVFLELSMIIIILYELPCSNHGDMTNSWEYLNYVQYYIRSAATYHILELLIITN